MSKNKKIRAPGLGRSIESKTNRSGAALLGAGFVFFLLNAGVSTWAVVYPVGGECGEPRRFAVNDVCLEQIYGS